MNVQSHYEKADEERGIKMLKIKFRYADAMSNWKWREQECTVDSVKECVELYGLGTDCEYEIISVKEINNK